MLFRNLRPAAKQYVAMLFLGDVPLYGNRVPVGETCVNHTLGDFSTSYLQPNNYRVGTRWVKLGTDLILLMQGATNAYHVRIVTQPFIDGWDAGVNGPINPAYFLGFNPDQSFWDALLTGVSNLYVFGHSAGGAFGVAFLQYARLRGFRGPMTCWTIGAPRESSRRGTSRLTGDTVFRLFRDDDPVPYIVPHSDEAPIYHVGLSRAGSAMANSSYAYGSSLRLDVDGTTVSQANPSLPGTSPSRDITAWTLSLMLGSTPTHGYDAYLDRLYQAWLLPVQEGPPAIARVSNFPPRATPAPISDTARQVVEAGWEVAHAVVPGRLVALSKDGLMTVAKVGTGYEVIFRGTSVAFFPRSKSARRFASGGNKMLRAMAKSQLVEGAGFVRSLADFLNAAASEDGPLRPSLRLGLGLPASGESMTF